MSEGVYLSPRSPDSCLFDFLVHGFSQTARLHCSFVYFHKGKYLGLSRHVTRPASKQGLVHTGCATHCVPLFSGPALHQPVARFSCDTRSIQCENWPHVIHSRFASAFAFPFVASRFIQNAPAALVDGSVSFRSRRSSPRQQPLGLSASCLKFEHEKLQTFIFVLSFCSFFKNKFSPSPIFDVNSPGTLPLATKSNVFLSFSVCPGARKSSCPNEKDCSLSQAQLSPSV